MLCAACNQPMRLHVNRKCPVEDLADIMQALDDQDEGELEPNEVPAVFVELLTLRHLAEKTGDAEPLDDRLGGLYPVDTCVLLRMAMGVIHGYVENIARIQDRTIEEVIQEIALGVAAGGSFA